MLCVGALTLDSIFKLDALPEGPGKFLAQDAVQIAAGMAASAATAAARLGGGVSLWASVGSDALADRLIEEIESEGVDCSLVRRVLGGRSALAAILVGPSGERVIVPFYEEAIQADPVDLPVPDLRGFGAVLADVRWPGAARLALDGARAIGIPAILDADVAPRATLTGLARSASHIVASEPASRILCGEGSLEKRVLQLAGDYECFAAITDGAQGTWWTQGSGQSLRHTPTPPVEAVDTLAAGDVFHGSFALAIARGLTPEQAIRCGSAAAAIKCRRFGGRLGAPNAAELARMLTWYEA